MSTEYKKNAPLEAARFRDHVIFDKPKIT